MGTLRGFSYPPLRQCLAEALFVFAAQHRQLAPLAGRAVNVGQGLPEAALLRIELDRAPESRDGRSAPAGLEEDVAAEVMGSRQGLGASQGRRARLFRLAEPVPAQLDLAGENLPPG